MLGVTLISGFLVAAQVASQEIKLKCREFDGPCDVENASPSPLADLKVNLVTEEDGNKINISWAVNIDGSIKYLTGTLIVIRGDTTYHCEYNPPLAEANLTRSIQKWFHYLVEVTYGSTIIEATNLPMPLRGSGNHYKYTKINVPRNIPRVTTTQDSIDETAALFMTPQTPLVPGNISFNSMAAAIFGGLASFMILSSLYIIYKHFGTSLSFKKVPTSPMVPVPVLVVYPAQNSAFQRAVVALAEFLQWHGGCSVAVDMWQQGKIAELGPMRWLAGQAKAADRVLIVCPRGEIPSSPPSDSLPSLSLPEPSIPAAAHDLYPLILNMVASHARSTSDLPKFWVVQLGEQHDWRSRNLPLELRACKTFCLMKDLVKLCRGLHAQRQDSKTRSKLIFGPGIEKSAVTVREAVQKLNKSVSNFREVEPLNSAVVTI